MTKMNRFIGKCGLVFTVALVVYQDKFQPNLFNVRDCFFLLFLGLGFFLLGFVLDDLAQS
jgi:hypothetical protein